MTDRLLTIIATITIGTLVGCGAAQPPLGAPGATPQSFAPAPRSKHGRDLLYVAAIGTTNVYAYPHGRRVSAIGGSTGVICSNGAGDVFLSQVNVDNIDEFQHGRSTPIAQLSEPFTNPQSCATDRTTGKLALVSSAGEGVAVFRPGRMHHWHQPRLYTQEARLVSCGYDASGNLFVDGYVSRYSGIIFAELPKGGSTFKNIALNYALTTPGTIQWDGQYLAVGDEDNTVIRRFAIQGSTGTQVGSVTLSGPSSLNQFWIRGTTVLGAAQSNSQVLFWNYPAGGSATQIISTQYPLGVTVSTPN